MNRIPPITTDRLLQLGHRIQFGTFVNWVAKRIVGLAINEHNLRSVAFTFDAKYRGTLVMRLHPVIITYHRFGAPSLFKPTFAEVVSQIPEDVVDQVSAFVIESDNLTSYNVLPDGYHFTKTHLLMK